MTKSKHNSNVEMVIRIMEQSEAGPLMQAFVIDALWKQVDRVIEYYDEHPEELENNNLLISGMAWQGCALALQKELQKGVK